MGAAPQVVERVSRYFPRSASGLPVGPSGSTFVRVLRMLRVRRRRRFIDATAKPNGTVLIWEINKNPSPLTRKSLIF